MVDIIDIGPETFTDGLVISHKGENYYLACGSLVTNKDGGGQSFCVKRTGHPSRIHEDYYGNLKADFSNDNSEVELSMEFTRFIRKPFTVEAVEVTVENIHELSQFIGDFGEDENGPYIQADRKKVPTVFRVVPGYWVTKMGSQIRCYSARVFMDQFIETSGPIEDWVKYINEGQVNVEADHE